jgi:hypothetical protein
VSRAGGDKTRILNQSKNHNQIRFNIENHYLDYKNLSKWSVNFSNYLVQDLSGYSFSGSVGRDSLAIIRVI